MTIDADPRGESITQYMADAVDPYPFFEQKRLTNPVWRGTVMDYSMAPAELVPAEEWTLFDYQNVFNAFRDDELFSSEGYDQTIGLVMGPTILAMPGKKHDAHRSLVAQAFKASALQQWGADVIIPICDALVDDFKERGEADLVEALTFEFPTRVTAALLGLPDEDLETFKKLSLELISIDSNIEAGLMASFKLHDYFLEQIEQRRRKSTDDIIGNLVSAEIDGEKLTDEAIISFLRLLLPAGLETTYRSSGNLLYLLLTHPDQLKAVEEDRSLIPQSMEEGLRFETPLTTVQRTVTRDVELSGVTVPAGATVDLCTGSANRDEARWENANEFNIRRRRQGHVAFAAGRHMCLGMHLARAETTAMLNSLFDRVQDLSLKPDHDAKIVGLTFRSPDKLPVTFRAKA